MPLPFLIVSVIVFLFFVFLIFLSCYLPFFENICVFCLGQFTLNFSNLRFNCWVIFCLRPLFALLPTRAQRSSDVFAVLLFLVYTGPKEVVIMK